MPLALTLQFYFLLMLLLILGIFDMSEAIVIVSAVIMILFLILEHQLEAWKRFIEFRVAIGYFDGHPENQVLILDVKRK